MTNDERASLVTQEYRFITLTDTSVNAAYPQAQDLVVDTNLDAAGAADYAASMFARTKAFGQTYTVPTEGVMTLDDFATQMPRFTMAFDRHPSIDPSTVFTTIVFSIDYSNGRTTLTERA